MKTTKRILSAVMALTLLLTCTISFASCKKDDGKYTVGIIQLVDHEALDAATQGFKDALIAELGEENVTFEYNNAAGSPDTCITIANTLVSKNVDLIMANATSALQAAANATVKIPISALRSPTTQPLSTLPTSTAPSAATFRVLPTSRPSRSRQR